MVMATIVKKLEKTIIVKQNSINYSVQTFKDFLKELFIILNSSQIFIVNFSQFIIKGYFHKNFTNLPRFLEQEH